MNLTKSLLITALLVAGITFGAYAQGGHGKGMRGKGQQAKICYDIPELTDEQESKIEKLRTAHMAKRTEFRNQMREKIAQLNSLTSGDNVDMKQAEKVSDNIASLRGKMLKERINHRNDIRSLLTDEQKVYFDNHKHKSKRKLGKSHRRMHPPKNMPRCGKF